MNIKQLVEELHKHYKKVKKFRKVKSFYKNNIWALDLIQMNELSEENNGYKYILNYIDIYSRYFVV